MKSLEFASVVSGKYIVAVSGGVDSMVLLDVLARQTNLELVVAHFDHGIRADSNEDQKLVCAAAAAQNLSYIYGAGNLGTAVSEADARTARYDFLRRAMKERNAKAVITAHHQDDVLETAILNLLRGTGRRGLSSLQSGDEVVRPLLNIPKSEIVSYARARNLLWREDSTNANEKYLRNYVRRNIVPRLGEAGRATLLEKIQTAKQLNAEIENVLRTELAAQPNAVTLRRSWFVALPYSVSLEVLAAFLRQNDARSFNARELHRLVAAIKTLPPGKRADVSAGRQLNIGKTEVNLTTSRLSQNRRFGV